MTRTALIAALLTVVAISAAVAAQEGDVMMVDFLLLRVRCPAAGYSVAERAEAIQHRVNDLLVLGGIDLDTVQVQMAGKDAVIYANGKVLVTVDECTARANSTTPEGLATVWANRFRDIYPRVVPTAPPSVTQ